MKAIGIDIGTAFIAGAKFHKENISAKYVRDGFFTMPYVKQRETMLKQSKVPFIVKDRPNAPGKKDIYVIGNEAFDMAVLFGQTLRRPLAGGVISAKEQGTEFILKEIIRRVAEQGDQGDVAYYSVPANPVDQDFNVIYHTEMFKRFLTDLGYKAIPLNEAMAVAYSELADKDLTGLTMSCLTPGQRVITDTGFTKIEDIYEDQKILTKEGKWASCRPTSRPYKGSVYKIWSNGAGKVEVTEDHKIWVQRLGTWQWIKAKDLKIGDLTKQPWPEFNLTTKRKYIHADKKTTCSTIKQHVMHEFNNELFELLGYFLGDGHITKSTNEIGFTLCKHETHLAKRVLSLLKKTFNVTGRVVKHGSGGIRATCNCVWLATWLDKYCYDTTRKKVMPWSISELTDNNLRFILKGLIETDGYIDFKNKTLSFHSTSPHLAQFAYLAMLRLNMAPSYCWQLPRTGGTVDGRVIVGKLDTYTITSSGLDALVFMTWLRDPVVTCKKTVTHGSLIAKISSITVSEYEGEVFDVQVDGEDHSFCVPGIAIHNCGAGMINLAMSYKGLEIFSFSVCKAGDFIDEQVAKSRGISVTDACAEKEDPELDLLNPKNDIQEAIAIFYKATLDYVVGHISEALEEHRRKIKLKEALPFVVAGGTSMPKGFLQLLANALKEHPLPIQVGKVWKAKNPVMAVCKGCLRAAQAELSDDSYDGSEDISKGQNTKHSYPKAVKKEAPKKPRTPKDDRKDDEKAQVMHQGGGGFSEAIDLEMEV